MSAERTPAGRPEVVALDEVDVCSFVLAADGSVLFANRAWVDRFGEPGEQPWGVFARVAAQESRRVPRLFAEAMKGRRTAEIEFTARRLDGSPATMQCVVSRRRADGSAVCLCHDVSEQRRHEERLAFMAGHDVLTGLPNRRALLESLERAASRSERGISSALLMLDLDHLKRYNDARGHLDGDQALINLAMLLRHHVRAADVAARIGGDEFAVLLEAATVEEALEIAERIRVAASDEEFVPGAREFGLGISGGIAVIRAGEDARSIIDRADAALYTAKAEGRDRIVVWSERLGTMGPSARVSTLVREAFAGDGFTLVFQPVVRLADRTVVYFESLIRMEVRGGERMVPAEFLPVVERAGLMSRLTRRVIDLALWHLAEARDASVSINLSAQDLVDPTLLEDAAAAVEAATSARGRIIFEIAESTLLSNLAGGRAWMQRLSPVGARFVLDDFATGIGMFVLLREPQIEQVKLSRTVIRALASEEGNRVFVGALRELIESQGKVAVAPYLETEELLGDVRQAGFTLGQGYFVGEPQEDLSALSARFGER